MASGEGRRGRNKTKHLLKQPKTLSMVASLSKGPLGQRKELILPYVKLILVGIKLNTCYEQDKYAGENKGQSEGKLCMSVKKLQRRQRKQILQKRASLSEAIRLDSYKEAKLEAMQSYSKSMLGSELQGEEFAKKMVDLVNQRKNFFAEERAKAKRNKPMTQSQLKTYMMNYLKNQGSWKLNQLRKLSFEELDRFGEELQTKIQRTEEDKVDEAKDDEPTRSLQREENQIAGKIEQQRLKYPLPAVRVIEDLLLSRFDDVKKYYLWKTEVTRQFLKPKVKAKVQRT
ncbi:hypothetical protein Tco_0246359 [Tanacetum coccineum]